MLDSKKNNTQHLFISLVTIFKIFIYCLFITVFIWLCLILVAARILAARGIFGCWCVNPWLPSVGSQFPY